MELLKDIIIDFCLFSLIEGWIYCLFFEKICGCNKFKWYQIIMLSFGNCIISQIFPPLIYQCFMILWMHLILNKINKFNIKNFKFGFFVMIFQLITEMPIAFLYDTIFKFDFVYQNCIVLFLFMMPIRFLQYYIINFIYNHNKV